MMRRPDAEINLHSSTCPEQEVPNGHHDIEVPVPHQTGFVVTAMVLTDLTDDPELEERMRSRKMTNSVDDLV